jgi:putative DNA primase/helicase
MSESERDAIARLADERCELFESDGKGFATFEVGDHRETWPVASTTFARTLARWHRDERERLPHKAALDDARSAIEGEALHGGVRHSVGVRVVASSDAVWLDLADDRWRVVRIDREGWRVVDGGQSPARFLRKRSTLPIPEPTRGGNVDALRSVVNVRDDDDWTLTVGWLVGSLMPSGPFPILAVTGEQGSAKSTLCTFLRTLVDPSKVALANPPRDVSDLAIRANACRVVAFDNLSGISPDLADALCRLATGSGFAKRALFTDDDEWTFEGARPIIANGIDDLSSRPDVRDRSIALHLDAIGERERRTERELLADFEALRPAVLGALLDAVSVALRDATTVRLERAPRMADFATFVEAAAPALGWARCRFVDAYLGNRQTAARATVEGSTLATAVAALGEWRGTLGELLSLLRERLPSSVEERDFRSPKALGNALRRLAPALREVGMAIEEPTRPTGRQKRREWTIRRTVADLAASDACELSRPAPSGTALRRESTADRADRADRRGPDAAEPDLVDGIPI